MQLHVKIQWEESVCEGVVQNRGSPGVEQWRVRISSGGESSDRRYGTAVNFERLLCVRPRGDEVQQLGWSTSSDWEKSNIWLLEICVCGIMFVQGTFESRKCLEKECFR